MSTFLITAGTGKTGRRIVQRLRDRGHDVRVGSRSADPPFDWDDDTTWTAALAGVDAAYLAYVPELALPGAADVVGGFAARAVAVGVTRLVLLAGRGEEAAERAEEAVRRSGAQLTIVRASFFDQNFDEGAFVDAVRAGQLVVNAGHVGEPFVDVEDLADVAVAALVDDRHVGAVYDVTGPRLLTFADVAAELSAVAGHPVRYQSATADETTSWLMAGGLPADDAAGVAAVFAKVLDGRNERLGDGVARALGRPGRDFTDYARRTAASGVWVGSEVSA
jgi:uncharacterized protein YbjT (DUF2867 family)